MVAVTFKVQTPTLDDLISLIIIIIIIILIIALKILFFEILQDLGLVDSVPPWYSP